MGITKKALEGRYGIRIADDSYIHPVSGKKVRQYKIYTADGCAWENGLKNLEAVKAECEKFAKDILSIKAKAESVRIRKMSYDELKELETELRDKLDYYSENSSERNEVYFQLEEVWATLKDREKLKVVVEEVYVDWRDNSEKVVKTHVVEGDTKEECFKKAYPFERRLRYCSGYHIRLQDDALNAEYKEWKKTGVTIEMYYGSGTVD